MKLITASRHEFVDRILRSSFKIIVYGYGVIGKVVAPYFINENGLSDCTLFWTDADINKQEEKVHINDRTYPVKDPGDIKEVRDPFVILITGSRYDSIIKAFESDPFYDDKEVYILPGMLADECRNFEKYDHGADHDKIRIPKIIHYCWFGKTEIPDELKKYMESWSSSCPDYEIKRWDENNYDIDKFRYSKDAYKHGKLGYVPDIVRLDLLYNYGGIYLDTDVEILRSLDNLLTFDGFIGTEKWGIVNAGGGSGAVPGHPMIGEMLEYKKGIAFEREDGSLNLESSGTTESIPLIKHGFIPNNRIQNINGLTILTSDFFQPYDYMTKETYITENTYGIHHFYGSWV